MCLDLHSIRANIMTFYLKLVSDSLLLLVGNLHQRDQEEISNRATLGRGSSQGQPAGGWVKVWGVGHLSLLRMWLPSSATASGDRVWKVAALHGRQAQKFRKLQSMPNSSIRIAVDCS